MEGERVFLSPVIRPVERLIYRVCGIDETVEQGWKGYAVSVLVMAFVAIVAGYVVLRLQDVLPLNQGGIPPMSPDLAFNTSVSFETQHELAELLGRERRHIPDPGRGPGGPQLHLGRDRPRHRDRAVPRPDPAQLEDHRQLLGGSDPRRALHPAADRDRRRPRPGLAGRAADVGPDADRDDTAGRAAEHRARSGRVPGVDQGAGQQRRRVLQRQLVASVREPDAADELARDLRLPDRLVLADLYVRPVRRRASARAGRSSPRWRSSCCRCGRRRCTCEYVGNPLFPAQRRSGRRRQHGGQGGPIRCGRRRAVHGRHDRHEHRRDQLLA